MGWKTRIDIITEPELELRMGCAAVVAYASGFLPSQVLGTAKIMNDRKLDQFGECSTKKISKKDDV